MQPQCCMQHASSVLMAAAPRQLVQPSKQLTASCTCHGCGQSTLSLRQVKDSREPASSELNLMQQKAREGAWKGSSSSHAQLAHAQLNATILCNTVLQGAVPWAAQQPYPPEACPFR